MKTDFPNEILEMLDKLGIIYSFHDVKNYLCLHHVDKGDYLELSKCCQKHGFLFCAKMDSECINMYMHCWGVIPIHRPIRLTFYIKEGE